MNLPVIVEVAIGLAFVYLAVSMLCSGINEVIAERVGRRGRFLREGLLNVVGDRWTYLRIVTHPLVASHYRDVPGKPRPPSYLPGGAFATAAIETVLLKAAHLAAAAPPVLPAPPQPLPGAPPAAAPATYAQLRTALTACAGAGDYMATALLPIVDAANGNLDLATRHIAAWYEATMERVSGWYKRYARRLLFLIGLVVAVVCNLDSIQIATALSRSATLRATVATIATDAARTGKIGEAPVQGASDPFDRINMISAKLAELEPVGLPVGFSCLTKVDPNTTAGGLWATVQTCLKHLDAEGGVGMLRRLVGWAVTAFAVSLGAPLWFDLLNRLVDVRGSGKKPPERTGLAAPRF